MRLDYGTLLCPEPVELSIGTLRPPTLRDIGRITFARFGTYQFFLSMTASDYYESVNKAEAEHWNALSEEERENVSVYDIVLLDGQLQSAYAAIFGFFFEEDVRFAEGCFAFYSPDDPEDVRGAVGEAAFEDVRDVLRQVCCLAGDDPEDESKQKFKNDKARMLWRKMHGGGEGGKRERKKPDPNMSLPNVISAVAAKSCSLNISNIWDVTLFQLYDQFHRLQVNDVHAISSISVGAWGDEKGKFDYALWYKNAFDRELQEDS